MGIFVGMAFIAIANLTLAFCFFLHYGIEKDEVKTAYTILILDIMLIVLSIICVLHLTGIYKLF